MDINDIPLDAREERYGTQYARISRTERAQVISRSFAFGVFDAKGRALGHSYVIKREFYIIDADSDMSCEIDQLDELLDESFVVYPQALRDGANFGAPPKADSYKRFRTLAEAEAYADNFIARAEKRAIKKASA